VIYLKFYVVLFVIAIALVAVGCSSTTQYGIDKTLDSAKDVMGNDQDKLARPPIPADASFTLDTENSLMNWHASKIVSNDHRGTIKLSSGNLLVENDEFISGDFVVDMSSIADNDGSETLENHLKSEDFFDIRNYSTSKFVLKSVEKLSDDSFFVTGDLTILDKTNEISFPAMMSYSGRQLTATASFDIDRTLWGITYSSGSIIKDLGDKAIKDDVEFDLDLVFNQN
jgi:polyisoprenoid-binding protein YceI